MKRGRMQLKHQIHRRQPVNMNLRACANSPAAGKSTHHRPKAEKSCAAAQVSVSTLSSIRLHEFYFELFAKCEVNGLSGCMAI
jgi:hypothetical protein